MAGVKGRSGTNKGKDKIFSDAVRLAVNREHEDGRKKIDHLAEKLVEEALIGESWAMQQVADRLDGKPAQAIEHSAEGTEESVDTRAQSRAIIHFIQSMPEPLASMMLAAIRGAAGIHEFEEPRNAQPNHLQRQH